MVKIVLIGGNIAHSRSPRLHNYLFDRLNIRCTYELLPLEPDEVVPMVRTMSRGGYLGANVTSPYKERVVAAMDDMSVEAEAIDAVNVIVFRDGRAHGFNTDAYAVMQTIQGHRVTSSPFSAAVLGSGGAAAAAVYTLLREPNLEQMTIYSRSLDRAQYQADRWNDARLVAGRLDQFRPADLVIHATPVGLPGTSGALLSEAQLHGVRVVFEMIYSPAETELVRRARAVGADVLLGMTMFIHQAVRSFELWTGIAVEYGDIPSTLFDMDTPS